jgi:hypothetical protein
VCSPLLLIIKKISSMQSSLILVSTTRCYLWQSV